MPTSLRHGHPPSSRIASRSLSAACGESLPATRLGCPTAAIAARTGFLTLQHDYRGAASCSRNLSLLSCPSVQSPSTQKRPPVASHLRLPARCHLSADDERTPDNPDLEPSLAAQFGRTRSSFGRLVSAHIGLLRAEIADIAGQLKMLATIGGIVLGLLLTMANMLYIGGFLFFGEWLFGSMDWGRGHGVLFALGLSLVLIRIKVGAGLAPAIASFAIAAVLTVGLALLLGTNV